MGVMILLLELKQLECLIIIFEQNSMPLKSLESSDRLEKKEERGPEYSVTLKRAMPVL